MIIKLEYSYYTKRPIIKGRIRFRSKDRVEGVFDFDTSVHWDQPNNYWNVVSDFLQDQGVTERYAFSVRKQKTNN